MSDSTSSHKAVNYMGTCWNREGSQKGRTGTEVRVGDRRRSLRKPSRIFPE